MDVLARIRGLMEEKNLNEYKLSQLSGVPQSTLNSLFNRNYIPSIPTLELICKGLGLTMAEFMSEGETPATLSPEQLKMFQKWSKLTRHQKEALMKLIESMEHE
ncbi:helix-turn-helix domain-containing protein [Harryflintia acetispora]|uniref:helix-turn-helix domain-containing protein n=1 Tax=Harryflintia acetispora TaxID=1849041 RepID=UPI001896B4DE|nr:helix-turn-helix transcriptional regulator [Harryflintia acetispora]